MSVADDRNTLSRLIEQLPKHDWLLPINDVHQKDDKGQDILVDGKPVIVKMGAHTRANELEAEISGIMKAYTVSQLLKEAVQPDADMGKILDAVKTLVLSYEGGQKAPQPDKEEAFFREKIDSVIKNLEEPAKSVVANIAGGQTSKTILELAVRSEAVQNSLTRLEPLPEILDTPVEGKTLRERAQEKSYQLTDEGHVLNQSTSRLAHIPDRDGLDGLKEAFKRLSNDGENAGNNVKTFIGKMLDSGWLEGKKEANIFDIGYGSPEATPEAIKIIKERRPGIKVNVIGVDLIKNEKMEANARAVLSAAGADSLTLMNGTFGTPEFNSAIQTQMIEGTETPIKNNMDLLVGSHVYNVGKAPNFAAQISDLQSEESFAIVQHERAKSWINDIRAKHPDKLRGGASTVVTDIESAVAAKSSETPEMSKKGLTDFSSAITVRFPEIKPEYIEIVEGMQKGIYTEDYTKNVPEADRKDLKDVINLLQFFARGELEAEGTEKRMAIVNDIVSEVQKHPEGLSSYVTMQIIPEPNASPELKTAVENAARASGRELAPLEERSRAATLNQLNLGNDNLPPR